MFLLIMVIWIYIIATNFPVNLPTYQPSSPYKICPSFRGRLGNHMFTFASSYAIARSKGMRVEIADDSYLLTMFDLDVDISNNQSDCGLQKYQIIQEHKAAAYDETVTRFISGISVRIRTFLQSWMYFDKYSIDIRKQFTFKEIIRNNATILINRFLSEHNITKRQSVTLVGVHVRRGDRVQLSLNMPAVGFKLATREYIHQSVKWYRDRFKNPMFIVASNGIEWAKENMPNDTTVTFLEHNTPEIDMATLAMCDQFISTFGTFSWWAGWLTGGNVTYFKWPATENGTFRNEYSKTYMDHYYPHWIGF